MSEYTYKIDFHNDGSLETERWFKDDKLHREGDKPAWIWYSNDGSLETECWYKDGRLYREGDKSALIFYHEDGSVYFEYDSEE
jgi:antitoxin component YwqK of YwqJK toxin-antitoxin module